MNLNLTKTLVFYHKWVIKLIMKTFVFLFCAVAFSLNPNNGFSQNAYIKVKPNSIISVNEVFKLLKKQTNYQFIYDADLTKDAPKIKLSKVKIKAKDLLDLALASTNSTYRFVNNTIIISKKDPASIKKLMQDTFTIKGVVKDEAGNPIPNVNVYASSTSSKDGTQNYVLRGTQTDFDGNFTIDISLNYYLIVSFVGYQSYEVQVTDKKMTFNIVLKEAFNQLDEVVVTGYTKKAKSNSSVAASKITKKAIERQVTTNLDDKLEGLSPGLTLNTVTPDGGQARLELVLRGVSTFDLPDDVRDPSVDRINSLNRQPLIILDGFPYEGPFNDIDAETIETIDVLRDAAATAIWGVRASNGVLVITTKRGRLGQAKISIKSNLTFGTKQDLSKFGFASSRDVIDILNRSQSLASPFGNIPLQAATSPVPFRRYRNLTSFQEIWAQFYAGNLTDVERDNNLNRLAQNDVLPQFEDQFIRGGFIIQNSLNINGGASNAKYNFTATQTKEERPTVGDDFRRLNLSLTTDFKINKRLKAVLDVNLVNSLAEDNGIGVSDLYTGNIINRFDNLFDANGNPQAIQNVFSGVRNEFITNGFDSSSYNPILDRRLRNNKRKGLNLRLAAGLNYEFFKGFKADVKFQYNRISDLIENIKSVNLFESRRRNNSYITALDTGNGVERGVPYGGTLERIDNLITNSVFRGTLSYDKLIADNHRLSALAGMEVSENNIVLNQQEFFAYNDKTGFYNRAFNPGAKEFTDNFGFVPGALLGGSVNNRNLFRPKIINRIISSFTNIGYTYANKYNAELSGKIDQASSFGISRRLSRPLLWAASASWNIAKEDFFKSDWVNQLKLRFSYGKNGNLRRGLSAVTIIGYGNNDRINGGNDAFITSPGNADLTFEKTTTKNIGIDFKIFNRIQGSIDLYDKFSTDLLSPKNINATFGQTTRRNPSVLTNNGEISNKGIELALAADIIKGDGLNWNFNFNISHNRNEVIKYGFLPNATASAYMFQVEENRTSIIGHPTSAVARYRWAGLDSNGDPQVYNDKNEAVSYLAAPDQLPTIAGLEITKPFISPTFGGLQNTVSYKNWSLSFLMTFKFGHVFQEDLRSKYPYLLTTGGGISGFHKDIANAWKNPGDENTTDIPAIPRTAAEARNFRRRDFFERSNLGIQSASHIRLKDIVLNYKLDEDVVKKVGFDAVSFTFQARNIGLLWTANDKGIDPESVPFSGRAVNFASVFQNAYRPGIRVPVSFVFGTTLNF